VKNLTKEQLKKIKPYIIALEHKDFECENTIIYGENSQEAFNILKDRNPGVVRDCRKIMIGLLDVIYTDDDKLKETLERNNLNRKSLKEELLDE